MNEILYWDDEGNLSTEKPLKNYSIVGTVKEIKPNGDVIVEAIYGDGNPKMETCDIKETKL